MWHLAKTTREILMFRLHYTSKAHWSSYNTCNASFYPPLHTSLQKCNLIITMMLHWRAVEKRPEEGRMQGARNGAAEA